MKINKSKIIKEIDSAKADGVSVGIILSAVIFHSIMNIIPNFWLGFLTFCISWFFAMALLIYPYAKKIESWLFSVKNIIIRRIIIVSVKGLALLIAMAVGIRNGAYWA